jgi:hypothetical protein
MVTIPKNAIVEVVSGSKDDRMTDVRWQEQSVMMFAQDLQERGELIESVPLRIAR